MDKKLEACAQAAYEVERARKIALGGMTLSWEDVDDEERDRVRAAVVDILAGNLLSTQLVCGTVRCMAATLGMSVTYPAFGDHPAKTVDFSDPFHREIS